MPPFCLGVGATAIGDFASAAGDAGARRAGGSLRPRHPQQRYRPAVSYNMQVDHGFAQPLEFLLGGLDRVPVLPVFINGVAAPLPGFNAPGCWARRWAALNTLNKRVLIPARADSRTSRRCRSWRRPTPICAIACSAAENSCRRTNANGANSGDHAARRFTEDPTRSIPSTRSGTTAL